MISKKIASSFPAVRMRRLRQNSAILHLIEETQLTCCDLIYPLFITKGKTKPIPTMPGINRISINELIPEIEEVAKLNIPAIVLFPNIEQEKKSLDAAEAYNEHGLVQTTVKKIKQQFPELLIITDVALDPYTSHGQDGLINEKGYVLNDTTNEVLVKQALSHAEAGADIVAPSDMMDGRIGLIRDALEQNGFTNTCILSYAAKYNSCFYGPFRDAIGSSSNLKGNSKASYQMNPTNHFEALREVELDLNEGADMVMIKPALPYLDVIHAVKQSFQAPTFAYQVSGEYAMIKFASQHSCFDEKKAILESLICIKRAGADAILTYFAKQVASWLK